MKGFYLLTLSVLLSTICLCARDNIINDNDNNINDNESTRPIQIGDELKDFMQGSPELRKAKSCDIVKQYIASLLGVQLSKFEKDKEIRKEITRDGTGMALSYEMGFGETLQGTREFSTTNVMEKGIDEADVVKTDGKFIFNISNNKLYISDVYPPESMTSVTGIQIKESEILIKDKKIFTFGGQSYYYGWWAELFWPYYRNPQANFVEYEFFENKLKINSLYTIEGVYNSARLKDDKIYIVGTSDLKISTYINALENVPKEFDNIYIADIDINSVLPTLSIISYKGNEIYVKPEPIAPCENIFISSVTEGTGIVWVYVVDTKSGEVKKYALLGVSGFMTNPKVYMSQNHLYVAFSSYDWAGWWRGSTDNSKTTIYKLSIRGEEIIFEGAAQLEGRIEDRWWSSRNSQFSINEYNGMLRLALSKGWGNEIDNIVYVLDEKLEVLGKISGIEKGEMIYAVRFVNEKGYVVTFRQIDPLVIIDMKDPKSPRIAGKLEIPGFSTYLHPLDDGRIVGIGRTGEWRSALKVSLFDVSNSENPQLITEVIISPKELFGTKSSYSYLYSEAEMDYRAVSFFKEYIAIPIIGGYEEYSSGKYSYKQFSGFYVLKVSKNNLERLGFLMPEPSSSEKCHYSYPLRAVFMDNYVYNVMSCGLWTFSIQDMSQISSLIFPF